MQPLAALTRHGDVAIGYRIAARCAALAMLALVNGYGLAAGGYLDRPGSPLRGIGDKLAGYVGLTAEKVRISGLKAHTGEAVLKAIGVEPGGSLIGFDARRARSLLENLDWVRSARVRVIQPGRLEIDIVEREPFIVWQRGGEYYVVDRDGSAISSLDPAAQHDLLLVSGEGARQAAEELINHLEGRVWLKSRIKAAARVGRRRWTLYLVGGLKVALPQTGVGAALERLERLHQRVAILDKAVAEIDLRLAGRVVVRPKPRDTNEEGRKLSMR